MPYLQSPATNELISLVSSRQPWGRGARSGEHRGDEGSLVLGQCGHVTEQRETLVSPVELSNSAPEMVHAHACMHIQRGTYVHAHMPTHGRAHTHICTGYTHSLTAGEILYLAPRGPLEMSPGGPWSSHSCTQAQQSEGTLSKTQLCLAVRKSRPTPPLSGRQGGEDQ